MSGVIISAWLIGITLFALFQPMAGPLIYYMMVWLSPDSQMYSGLSLRWTLMIAISSLVGYLSLGDRRKSPGNYIVFFVVLLAVWYLLSAFVNNIEGRDFTLATDFAKITLMCWVTASLVITRARIHALIWVLIIAIGGVSLRTGVMTAIVGGGGAIIGPTHLGHTNEYARFVIYTWPFMLFLARHSAHYYVRLGNGVLAAAAVLTLIGTNSRGAFVAFAAMCFILWLYGKSKILPIVLIGTFLSVAYFVLPPQRLESFTSRTATIENAEEDNSFLARTESWAFGWSYALENPFFGGGAGVFERLHKFAAHSNYFEVLGESGFVGLGIYAIIAVLAFMTVFRIRRLSRGITELIWAHDLAFYIMISLVGYFVGGLTKNHGFNEYYYMLLGILMGLETAVKNYLVEQAQSVGLEQSAFGSSLTARAK